MTLIQQITVFRKEEMALTYEEQTMTFLYRFYPTLSSLPCVLSEQRHLGYQDVYQPVTQTDDISQVKLTG